jgi:hypothetical protein
MAQIIDQNGTLIEDQNGAIIIDSSIASGASALGFVPVTIPSQAPSAENMTDAGTGLSNGN